MASVSIPVAWEILPPFARISFAEMSLDRDRLYVALYARAGSPKMPGLEDTYHWALIVGPNVEPEGNLAQGMRFHAKERIDIASTTRPFAWVYDEHNIKLRPTGMLLCRVIIGKVEDKDRLRAIFQKTPIREGVPGWNCVVWVKEAIEAAMQDGRALAACAKSWGLVRDTVMWYVEAKKASHRFDGKGNYDYKKTATWDLLENMENTP
ncbi:hypothetical protein GGR51DRAFT_563170 [Nemania sp. FL0031]|nr:hypothetical protein GGR51DRAFT_563170 [Nemania sp. FL0031]